MDLRQIQEQVVREVQGSELVGAIAHGSIRREQYTAYLTDVYHYACHSAQVIGLAGSRMVRSHPQLADYLFSHAREELGHEHWATSDLRDLGRTDEDIARSTASEACTKMLGLEYLYAAHLNPVGLFGWMFVLESLDGRVGGSIANALDAALKLEGKALYFLRSHGEADAHHSEDLARVIEAHIISAEDQDDFQTMVSLSRKAYLEILDDVAKVKEQPVRNVARN